MRKKLAKLCVGAALAFTLAGCGGAIGITPVTGMYYTDVKGTYGGVTPLEGYSKVGKASCQSILGIIATGDCSIKKAMENGGITKIHHVDYHTKSILGIIATHTVIVYGE